MSIIVDKEFKNLIPPLSAEEYTQLERNILKDGIRDALVVWKTSPTDYTLIDGHNRFQIAAAHHGIHFTTKEMEFADRDEAKAWIIRNQFGRRNLSAYDRSVLALKLKPIIAEQAKERMSEAPQKKAEREKEIKKIWEEHDFDTARNLVALKRQEYGRKDRAKIMASGKFIYFARFDYDKLKIGSSICPEDRVKQLAISCPDIELIEAVFFGDGAEKHENAIKKKYEQYRVGNECYKCSDEILFQMISFTKKEAARKSNTDYELAKIAGVSHDTIHKVETIENSTDEKLKEQVRSGDVSINQAYRAVKGIEDKSPAQINKDFLQNIKDNHKKVKEGKTVNFTAVVSDKEDQKYMAMDTYARLLRMGKGIEEVSMEIAEGELDLEWAAKGMIQSEKDNLIMSIAIWVMQLKTITEVLNA